MGLGCLENLRARGLSCGGMLRANDSHKGLLSGLASAIHHHKVYLKSYQLQSLQGPFKDGHRVLRQYSCRSNALGVYQKY